MRWAKKSPVLCSVYFGVVTCLSSFFWVNADAVDLLGAYQQAKLNAPLLRSYVETQQSAQQGYFAAVGGLFPSVSLSASGDATAYNIPGYNEAYLSDTEQVSFSQPILNLNLWGQTLYQGDLASAAEATYQANLESFTLTVATDYFNILEDQDTLASDQAAVSFYGETLKQTQEKFQAGLSTIKDVKQAEANYDLSYATQIKDQSQLQTDVSNLSKLTGVRYTDLAAPKENFPFDSPDPADLDHWVKQAEVGNKTLLAARLTADASKQNITQAVGNQLPQVSFVGSYGLTHTNASSAALENNFGGHESAHSWSVQLEASWNIFQGSALFATTIQAARNYDAETDTVLQDYRNTVAQTRQDYRSVLSDIAQVAALKQAVIADQFSLKQLDEEYKVGTETIVNVLDQANQLFSDRKSYTQAEYKYMTDRLTLQQDVGSLGAPEIMALNQWLTTAKTNPSNLDLFSQDTSSKKA